MDGDDDRALKQKNVLFSILYFVVNRLLLYYIQYVKRFFSKYHYFYFEKSVEPGG